MIVLIIFIKCFCDVSFVCMAEYKVQFFIDERFEFGDRICYGCLKIEFEKSSQVLLTAILLSCFFEREPKRP